VRIVYVFAFCVSICAGNMFPVVIYGQDSFDFTIAGTPYRVSLAATTGLLIGQAEEIVYNVYDYDKSTDSYLSELLWDMKPLVYLGSALSFSRSDPLSGLGAALDMSVKFGLPLRSGTHENRDWQNPKDPNQLTDFSTHDVYLEGGALLLDASGGITIPIKSVVAVKALVSLSYMQFSWAGKDGYGDYLEYDLFNGYGNERERKDYDGTVITYEQAWLIISPGIGVFWPLGRALSLDFRFFISPWIYAGDEDNHLIATPPARYNDYMRGGLYLEPSLDIAFAPNRFFSLVLRGSWRHIAGTRGDMAKNGSPIYNENKASAGAGFSAFDIGLSGKFALPLGRVGRK
jgi:outer membrane protease